MNKSLEDFLHSLIPNCWISPRAGKLYVFCLYTQKLCQTIKVCSFQVIYQLFSNSNYWNSMGIYRENFQAIFGLLSFMQLYI